jgi:hypothetical protein
MKPEPGADHKPGEFSKFTDFMRRLVAVPHSEIKSQLDAEKQAKLRKQTPSTSASGHASTDED